MAKRKRKRKGGGDGTAEELGSPSSYEKIREERIRENLERIQKLGITSIKSSLEKSSRSSKKFANAAAIATKSPLKLPLPLPLPTRRSSRLQSASPISYAEICVKKVGKSARDGSILVQQGEVEEVYADEHVALLGSCETSWTLFVDGYGKDGNRIYDQIKGKTCHQCRQKTLGHHTRCSKCNLVQGQFCGDCLYMRYGENVLEVKKNVNWICPVCRGICNCSLCRTKKGWAPTGALYRKVFNLGYKSVAHYLIQTRRKQTSLGNQTSSNPSLVIEGTNDLNTDTAGDNCNEAETEGPSNGLESPILETGSNVESIENDNICLNHTNKVTVPGKTEKPRQDSIASRLRKRVPRPQVAK